MKRTLFLDNIKCGGCANSIATKLKSKGVEEVEVNIDEGSVSFTDVNEEHVDEVKKWLKAMGYPERDQSNFGDAAKSYVSCMIGRIKSDA